MKSTEHTKKRRVKNRFLYDNRTPYLYLLPGFVLITVFVVIPLIMAVISSFQDYYSHEFVGFKNYDFVLQLGSLIRNGWENGASIFMVSFANVLRFTAIIVAVQLLLSFSFASVLVRTKNRMSKVARVLIYVPNVISGIIASVAFTMLFNYGGGLFNSLLISAGKDAIAFESQESWPQVSVILPTLWLGFGYNTLVMYAGLSNIPQVYYEAAEIDGAGAMAKLFKITLPHMKNYFVLLLIGLVTGTMQMFDVPFMMTDGGPLNTTSTPVLYLYGLFSDPAAPQNASIAGSVIVMITVSIVNLFVFKVIKSEKSQE